jgi:thiol-disulfide isomerase/thioredoxin
MNPSPPSGAQGNPYRILLYAAIGFSVFWFAYLTFFGPKGSSARLEHSGMSEPATYDWTVLDLDDQPVAFSRFKGKPVFLNFWATWCGPCVREMPSIDKLARDPRLAGKSIEFVCVSVDDDSETVRQYLNGKNFGMKFLRVKDRKIPHVYHSDGIPATFLITADGRIAATEVGSADWHEPHVVEFMEKLAAGR